MEVNETEIAGCFEIIPTVYGDKRGYFFESFNLQKFKNVTGIEPQFVQDNQSMSSKGVLRGLHFQKGEHAQAKLVRVIQGEVLDVAVDLRPESPTFKQVACFVLNAEDHKQIFIPRGCAHGFITLEDQTIFSYKCDNYYNKESEGGIFYADPDLKIDWKLEFDDYNISDKDILLPTLNEYLDTLK